MRDVRDVLIRDVRDVLIRHSAGLLWKERENGGKTLCLAKQIIIIIIMINIVAKSGTVKTKSSGVQE